MEHRTNARGAEGAQGGMPDGTVLLALERAGVLPDALRGPMILTGDGIMLDQQSKKGIKVREQLSNQDNFAYFGKLYMGNPPQEIECIFDTGSANPWVASRHVRDSVADFD